MAASSDKDKEMASVVVDASTLRALNPETLDRLKNEFGAKFELHASKEGLASLLDSVNRAKSLTGSVPPVGAYDRGFDRTSPGYDKFYDRDRAILTASTASDAVVNPAETLPALDLSMLSRVIR